MDPRDRKSTFDILKVDFEWVKQTKSVKELRQALAALKEEGGYLELEKEIETKLERLAPTAKRPTNSLSAEERKTLDQELETWQREVEQADRKLADGDPQEAVERRLRAEREKQKGNEFMRSKDYQLAIDAYTIAHSLDPTNAVVLSNRSQAHLNQKNFQKALEDSEAVLRLDPQFVKGHHRRGKALSAMQRYSEALCSFKQVLSLDPSNAEAAAEAQKCRQHVPDSSFKSVAIEEDSDESGSERQSPDSVGDSETAVSEGLSRVDALKAEGNALFQHGNFGEAMQKYEDALAETKGMAGKGLEKVNEAKAALYNNLAACYSQTEELHRVIECSTAAVDLVQPNSVLKTKALLRRALAYEKLEKIDSAKRDMELVKTLDPGNMQASQALQRYFKVLLEGRQRSAARKELDTQQLLTLVDKIKENGNKCFSAEDFDNAILEFTAGLRKMEEKIEEDAELKLHPQIIARQVALLCNRAAANLKLECNALVIQDCKAALSLDKDNVKALYRLSKAHENCGQLPDAGKCLEQVLQIDPKNTSIRKELESIKKRLQSLQSAPKTQTHEKERKRKVSFRADLAEQIPDSERGTNREESKLSGKVVEVAQTNAPTRVVSTDRVTPSGKTAISAEVIAEAKSIATSLVGDFDVPASATAFQTHIKSLKSDQSSISSYLQHQTPAHISSLFSRSEMDIDLMLTLFRCLLASPASDPAWLYALLDAISTSYRFDLTAKMLSKTDKVQIGRLIEESGGSSEEKQRLRSKYRME